MKKLLTWILGIMMAFALIGCGQNSGNTSNAAKETQTTTQTEQTQIAQVSTEGVETAVQDVTSGIAPNSMQEVTTQAASNVLVAYFSLAGEQYNVGVIEEGNTAIVAKMIAQKTGADIFEIVPVNAYPSSHSELLNVAKSEQSKNARPAIAGTVNNMAQYDVVYIGFPNWWGDMPMIVYNFLESYDFGGKTVIPFCTHGGSGFSGTEKSIAKICKGANMLEGFAIAGETAQNDRAKTDSAVSAWLSKIGR